MYLFGYYNLFHYFCIIKIKYYITNSVSIMTKQEFTQRVGMQVSAEEYSAIEQVYMASDVDKDEFCRLWVKMNAQRVSAAKQLARQQEKERKQHEQLWEIVMKYGGMSYETMNSVASEMLTKKQASLCAAVGIQMESEYYGQRDKSLSTVLYEIKKYLKAA